MFSIKRFLAVFTARNIEFVRDRSALGWNIIFPILLVAGFAFMFSNENKVQFRVAVDHALPDYNNRVLVDRSDFFSNKFINFVVVKNLDDALTKLKHHQYDMVVKLDRADQYAENGVFNYWINSTSDKGLVLEKVLWGSLRSQYSSYFDIHKQTVSGHEIPYVDWVLPGILALNMMFSCLFGIGYIIVRYRKIGVLKRFKATPLSKLEFLLAQIFSRLIIVISTTFIVFLGSFLIINFRVEGSYFDLLLIYAIGAVCLISLALIIAAQTTSEEYANGILNVLSWPMLIFSGIWFSLQGLHPFAQSIAYLLPLTHVIEAARQIMNDGHNLAQVLDHILILLAMTVVFLTIGTWRFQWIKS